MLKSRSTRFHHAFFVDCVFRVAPAKAYPGSQELTSSARSSTASLEFRMNKQRNVLVSPVLPNR